jgi:hypothetical protein
LLVRVVLLAAGLLFAGFLLVGLGFIVAAWSLRSAWARLTGRPATPFVFRVDPHAGFGRVWRGRAAAQDEPARAGKQASADVTDVQIKPPRT